MADEAKAPEKATPPPAIEVQVGDEKRTMTPVEIAAMVEETTRLKTSAAPIFESVKRWGIDPQAYAQNADAAFGVINDLIEQGIIDPQGKPIAPRGGGPANQQAQQLSKPFGAPDSIAGQQTLPGSASENVVQDTVKKALAPLMQKIEALESDNSYLYHQRLVDKIVSKYDGVSPQDAGKILAAASRDRTRSIDDHAKAYVSGMQTSIADMEKNFAKKYGLNLDELERANKMRGNKMTATDFGKGARFSFKKSGEGNVDPGRAAREYLARVQSK